MKGVDCPTWKVAEGRCCSCCRAKAFAEAVVDPGKETSVGRASMELGSELHGWLTRRCWRLPG
jgi:hypothetical protein